MQHNIPPFHSIEAKPAADSQLLRGRHRTVGADPNCIESARKLRKEMSLPEVQLWRELRGKPLGLKFRRQFPIAGFVADFACVEMRMLIEIDGIAHDLGARPQRDVQRDAVLTDRGWKVVRITATEVLQDGRAVAASIIALAESFRSLHHPAGSPPACSGEFTA